MSTQLAAMAIGMIDSASVVTAGGGVGIRARGYEHVAAEEEKLFISR